MKYRKSLLSILLVIGIIVSNIAVNRYGVIAAGNITVKVDGQAVQFDVQPMIINERTMVPFRKIGEAMGANVAWDPDTREVTMILGDKYVKLYVDNENMLYGEVSVDSTTGLIDYVTKKPYTLEAPPVIVNNVTLVSARAIGEGFGAEVTWDKANSIVNIMSSPNTAAEQTASPAGTEITPTETPATDDPAFDDTEYFQQIQGIRAQDMYSHGKVNYAFVYYDSKDAKSKEAMETIKSAASIAEYKVFGVDVSSTRFTKPENLKFIYDYVDKDELKYPTIFFVYFKYSGLSGVEYATEWGEANDLSEMFKKLKANVSAVPSPSPSEPPSAPPTETVVEKPVLSSYWKVLTKTESTIKNSNNERFIFVYMDSTKSGYEEDIKVIIDAVEEAKVEVYYGDWEAGGDSWFGSNLLGADTPSPTVFFLFGSSGSYNMIKQPTDLQSLLYEMKRFGM